MRNLIQFHVTMYRFMMDPSVSPLRHLPPAQRFQAMCALGTMWTFIFMISTGLWAYYGLLLAGHALFALGVIVTHLVFHEASAKQL